MGITGLWETVKPTAESVSFRAFTLGEAVQKKNTENRNVILGVDMRAMMCECTAATLAAGVHGQFQGGAVRIFFSKLCGLRKGAATLVFILDGSGRPGIKRGVKVVNKEIWWTPQAIELVTHFGYYHYEAPGEAEAELAQLNLRGLIDGVITSDSDTLVFGAPLILRSILKQSKTTYDDEMVLYTSNSIHHHLSLTLGGLLLFALLSGGDYGDGVYSCGRIVALGLARCGFGDQLLEAVERNEDLTIFLPCLRDRICAELRENSQGELEARHPSLAAHFPDNFPDKKILDLYSKPLTSWSCTREIPSQGNWKTREPSIAKIAQFCHDNFGWKDEAVLMEKLRNHLWEAIFAQMLFSPLLLYNPKSKVLATPNVQAKVLSAGRKARKGQFSALGLQPKLMISVENFVHLMGREYSTDHLKPLGVWASDDFLPAGVIQTKKPASGKRKKEQHTTNMSPPTLSRDTGMAGLKRKAVDALHPNQEEKLSGKRMRPDRSHGSLCPEAQKFGDVALSHESFIRDGVPVGTVDSMVSKPSAAMGTSKDFIDLTEPEERFISRGSSTTAINLKETKPSIRHNSPMEVIDLT